MLKKFKMPKDLSIDKLKSKVKFEDFKFKDFKFKDFNFEVAGLHTIKGKVMAMAIIPVVAIIILTIMILNVLGNNSRDYDLLLAMDEVKNIQKQNQVLNEEYYYTLNNDVWNSMNENLKLMNEKTQAMQSQTSFTIKNEMSDIAKIIEANSAITSQIIEKNALRGFYNSEGLFAEYVKNDQELQNTLHSAQWDSSWIDLRMDSISAFSGEAVNVDGNNYYKARYEAALPKQGRRNQFLVRMGTVDLQYTSDIYINNIVLSNAQEELKVNLGEIKVDDLAGTSGPLSAYELAKFNGEDSIKVTANFNVVDNSWQEIMVYLSIANIDITKYDTIAYELYTTGNMLNSVSLGGALQSRYSFVDKYYAINGSIDTYNRAVARGDINWADEKSEVKTLINTLLSGFKEIRDNLPDYIIDEAFVQNAVTMVSNKISALEQIQKVDEEILALKVEKVNLEEQLTQDINTMREEIQTGINTRKQTMQFLVLVITAILLVLVTGMVIYITRSLNSSIKSFSDTLDEMAQGNLTVRCEIASKDEFSIFAASLNTFTDKLCHILNDIQILVNDVEQKNRLFGELFKQITEGPQAGETVLVEKGMLELKEVFEEIISSVSVQNTNTDRALNSLNGIVDKNSTILERMQTTKETSDCALDKVQEGYESIKELISEVKNINVSVGNANQEVDALIKNAEDIGDILVSIQNLSKQTDLLSLNAAIEASRAGESGKGFAVVAAEIKKLSEQTSKETQAIDSLIKEINSKIDKVQSANKAVVNNVDNTLQITDQFAMAITEVTHSTQSSTKAINDLFTTIEAQNKSVLEIANLVEQISEEANEVQNQAEITTDITKQVSKAMVDNLEEIEKLMKDTTKLKTGIEFFKTENDCD